MLFQTLTPLEIVYLLEEVKKKIENSLLNHSSMKSNKLDLRQYLFLYHLYQKEPLSVSDLSRSLSCSQPHISQLFKKLEKKALVYKVKDEEDQRSNLLRLSNQGRDLVRDLQTQHIKVEEQIESSMKAIDIDLFRVLRFFSSNFGVDDKTVPTVLPPKTETPSEPEKPDRKIRVLSFDQSEPVRSAQLKNLVSIRGYIERCFDSWGIEMSVEDFLSLHVDQLWLDNCSVFGVDDEVKAVISWMHDERNMFELYILWDESIPLKAAVIVEEVERIKSIAKKLELNTVYLTISDKQQELSTLLQRNGFEIITAKENNNHYGRLFFKSFLT